MQSRLAITWKRCLWAHQPLQRKFLAAAYSSSTGRTADPSIYSGEVEAGPEVHTSEPHGAKNETGFGSGSESETRSVGQSKVNEEPLVRPKPPHVTSTRLENAGLNQPNPIHQQKRRKSSVVEEVSCVGVDGTPLSGEGGGRDEGKVEDDKEYFKHHKASPLSEMEMADTRKPITRASDGTAGVSGRDVIGWLPEQLDTAEDSLMRAALMFKDRAMRGDPETFPHSRILRQLRGEWF